MKLKTLLLTTFSLFILGNASAQLDGACPGCVANTAQFGTNISTFSVGLFPDSLIITQNDSIDTVVTYLLPQQINTGISVAPTATVTEVQILGISATSPLPAGIHATCDNYSTQCQYYPQTYRFGCVKICGITAQAATNGWVEADITVAGTGTAAGTTETQNENIKFYYMILPDTSACHTVCFQNKINKGCDSATIGVQAGIDIACASPILNPCSFDWNYGNGTTGTGLTTQSVNYSTPGIYPVTLSTHTGQLVITAATFTTPDDPALLGFLPCSSGCAWYNNICNGFGVNNSANNFHLNFTIGTTNFSTSGAGGGHETGSFTGLNYPVTSQAIAISLGDGCLATNLTSSTGTATVTGPGTYTFACGSDATGTFTVSLEPMDSATYSDSVYIYASPDTPVITLSKDSVCKGDSIMLSIDSATYTGFTTLWYQDSTYIQGAAGTAIYVHNQGNYSVKVTNPATGCQAVSAPTPVAVSGQLPQAANIYFSSGSNQLFLNPFLQGTYAEWYFDSTLVTGQNGRFLPSLGAGKYYVIVYPTGYPHCSLTSSIYTLTNSGITETPGDVTDLSVYPNPTNGSFTMRVSISTPGTVSVKLTDVLGRVVYENSLMNQSGEVQDNINGSAFSKGVYTLEVSTDNGSATKRVVIE